MLDWRYMCKRNEKSVYHLLLHSLVANELWNMVFDLFGVQWIMLQKVLDLLASWEGRFGRHRNMAIWKVKPHSLMWSPWQETNSRSFEGSEQSILELMSFFFYSLFDRTLALQSFSYCSLLFMLIVTREVKGMFGNVVLVTLFKCCGNTCG